MAFYRWVMELISAHGTVYADAGGHGAAVWQAPMPPKPTGLGEFRLAASMALRMRSSLLRAARLNEVVSQAHVREPHWYLALLGTEPAAQGRGIGAALMAPVLRQCDEMRVIAYLESSKESNISFYELHGFRVQAELEVARGPRLWPMLREPMPMRET